MLWNFYVLKEEYQGHHLKQKILFTWFHRVEKECQFYFYCDLCFNDNMVAMFVDRKVKGSIKGKLQT